MVCVEVVVAVVHHISWAAVRAGPSKHMGRVMDQAERPIYSLHLMGSGPGRPVKTHGPLHGAGGAAYIQPTSHGALPGPDQISRGWAASRPSPSYSQTLTARPGPGHQNFKRLGPAWHITLSISSRHNVEIGPARHGPDKRPMTTPEFCSLH